MANFENLVVAGTIISTSNKTYNDEPITDKTRKSAYVEAATSEDIAALEKYGLRKYTSKEGQDFFIIKLSKELSIYKQGASEELYKLPTTPTDTNIMTEVPVKLALTKGVKSNNVFHRIYAIQVTNESDIQNVTAANPFE